MPLTECPDCGGIVSDAAITCPTCHRVLATARTKQASMRMVCVRWALVGAAAIAALWVFVQILA